MTKSEIAISFSGGNFEICFGFLTDQTIWNIPGEKKLTGRKEIEPYCKKISAYFKTVSTNFKQLNLIENIHCVAINGTAEFFREGKKISFVSSCDVYEFDVDDKINSITSYCITEKFMGN